MHLRELAVLASVVFAAAIASTVAFLYQERRFAMFLWLSGRRVLLVRHGNTGKATSDAARQITDRGTRQCAAFRGTYDVELSAVGHVFCSPVARTVTTARLLHGAEATLVDDLYFGNIITDEHREVDRAIGYAPVADYLTKHAALYAAPAKRMASSLDAAGSQLGSSATKSGDVLVVGHAIYLSLLTLEVIKALNGSTLSSEAAAAGEKVVLEANLAEVEGFLISADGVRYLRNSVEEEESASLGGGAAKRNDDFVVSS